jgi:hypothetical protein
MKKITTLLLLISIISTYSQNRYTEISTSTYTPRTTSEIMSVPMALQGKYNENQKYLYALKKWVLELKTEMQSQEFTVRLNREYQDLTAIENGDLARATTYLNQTENAINEIISDYKIKSTKINSTKIIFETSVISDISLRSEPSSGANEVYKCPKDAIVYVYDNSSELYFKVVVNGYSGYISKHYLRRQW